MAATVLVSSLLALEAGGGDANPTDAPLVLTKSIALPGVKGRIDHVALDAKRKRLYVAALGNGSVEVVSVEKGEWLRSIGGLEEPQGVAFLNDFDRVAIACGGDGSVRFYAGEKTESVGKVDLGNDADNVHYDAAVKRLWVAFGDGGLAGIDPAAAKETGRALLDAHPEGFALETSGTRAFINLASKGEVVVVDREALKVTVRWKLGGATANFPMALDEAAKRLYVGCRSPSRLVVLRTDDGQVEAAEACTDDPDDIFVDEGRKRVYVVCGGGTIDVFDLTGTGPKLHSRVATEKGARTALLDNETGALYVAVPRRGSKEAEIRVYEPR